MSGASFCGHVWQTDALETIDAGRLKINLDGIHSGCNFESKILFDDKMWVVELKDMLGSYTLVLSIIGSTAMRFIKECD